MRRSVRVLMWRQRRLFFFLFPTQFRFNHAFAPPSLKKYAEYEKWIRFMIGNIFSLEMYLSRICYLCATNFWLSRDACVGSPQKKIIIICWKKRALNESFRWKTEMNSFARSSACLSVCVCVCVKCLLHNMLRSTNLTSHSQPQIIIINTYESLYARYRQLHW